VTVTYTWTLASKPVITTTAVSGDLGINPTVVAPTFTGTDNCEGTIVPNVTTSSPVKNGCTYTQTWNASYTSTCNIAANQVSITYTWSIEDETITLPNSILTLCGEKEIELNALMIPDNESTIEWFDSNNTKVGTGKTITVNPPSIGGNTHRSEHNYKVVATLCGRTEYMMTVHVDKPLTGEIPEVEPICEDKNVSLDAGSYGAESYVWTSPSYAGQESGAQQIVSPTETTWYYVYMERGACNKLDSILVKVSRKPVIDRIDSLDTRTREIVLKDGVGTSPFAYKVDHFPYDENPVKTGLFFGNRTFYVVDDFGCSSDPFIYLVEAPKLFIPPYFTPNGDGTNDTWEVENLKDVYPDAVVTIYDRFGKKLIEYKGSAEQGWDGTYLGREMPTTDYWYEINIKEINVQYVGHFTLLRR
jgi:gliding motility-associated-like protein